MPDLFIAENPNEPVSPSVKTSIKTADTKNLLANLDMTPSPQHLLSSFCKYPQGVKFQSQEPDEVIVLLLRRSAITNISWIIIAILLSILPLFFPAFFFFFSIPTLPNDLAVILLGSYYSLILGYILTQFANWFYNIGIVTNIKVVDIDYANVTYKDVASANLEHIQDVDYNQSGFLRSFFNYGDITIRTQGSKPNIEFIAVPQPAVVVNIILKLMEGRSDA